MSSSAGFSEMLCDLLAPLGSISMRRMFSGGGVYCDGLMFGLVMDDAFYLKVDDESRKSFEAHGCGPFVYVGKSKPVATSYWRAPDLLLDEPEEMLCWARVALGVARKRAFVKSKKGSGKARKVTRTLKSSG